MRTITQTELENDFDNILEYVRENQEGVCIISNAENKSVMLSIEAYQIFMGKKITVCGDDVTEEPLSDSEKSKLLSTFIK